MHYYYWFYLEQDHPKKLKRCWIWSTYLISTLIEFLTKGNPIFIVYENVNFLHKYYLQIVSNLWIVLGFRNITSRCILLSCNIMMIFIFSRCIAQNIFIHKNVHWIYLNTNSPWQARFLNVSMHSNLFFSPCFYIVTTRHQFI